MQCGAVSLTSVAWGLEQAKLLFSFLKQSKRINQGRLWIWILLVNSKSSATSDADTESPLEKCLSQLHFQQSSNENILFSNAGLHLNKKEFIDLLNSEDVTYSHESLNCILVELNYEKLQPALF